MPVEIELPTERPHAVAVHTYFDAPPIRSATFSGKIALDVLAVSPVVLVRMDESAPKRPQPQKARSAE